MRKTAFCRNLYIKCFSVPYPFAYNLFRPSICIKTRCINVCPAHTYIFVHNKNASFSLIPSPKYAVPKSIRELFLQNTSEYLILIHLSSLYISKAPHIQKERLYMLYQNLRCTMGLLHL